jgi:hypothetical protein
MSTFAGIFGLILVVSAELFGQTALAQLTANTACSLTKDESPALLGLKLGMTPSEVSNVLGRNISARDILTKILVKKITKDGVVVQNELSTKSYIGEKEYAYYPHNDSNVGSIYLRFWDKSLYTVALDYDPRDFDWSTQRSDSQVIAEKLGLPFDYWEGSRLACSDFYVDAARTSDGVCIELTDSVTKDKLKIIAEKTISDEANLLGPAPTLRKKEPPALKNKIDPPVLKVKKRVTISCAFHSHLSSSTVPFTPNPKNL